VIFTRLFQMAASDMPCDDFDQVLWRWRRGGSGCNRMAIVYIGLNRRGSVPWSQMTVRGCLRRQGQCARSVREFSAMTLGIRSSANQFHTIRFHEIFLVPNRALVFVLYMPEYRNKISCLLCPMSQTLGSSVKS
jgi:hypothetical protein